MNSNEIIQVLLESISQITEAKLENLPYDKTLVCTIVDDSQKKDSIYTVQKDSVKFKVRAAGDRTYSVNQQVYVKVPLGDMSSDDKYIEGIYAADAENILNLVTARDRLIQGDNLILNIGKSASIVPNKTSFVPIGFIKGFKEENFDTIYISAKFKTAFNDYHIVEGNYGLSLIFLSKDIESFDKINTDDVLATFKLDNIEDMFGDTYQYVFPMKQEQIYTLKNIKGIKTAAVVLYQSGNFKYMNDFGEINVLPVEPESPITVSDIEVLYGFNSIDKPADTIELVCSESKEYGGEGPAERNVQLFWYNYVNDRYVGFNSATLDNSEGAKKAKTTQGIISSIVQPQVSDVEKYYYYIEGLSNLNFYTTQTKLLRDGIELKVGDRVYYSLNNGKLEIYTNQVAEGVHYWIDWYVTNDFGALELDPNASGIKYKVTCSPYADPGVDVKAVLWVNGKEYSDTMSFTNTNPLLQTILDLSGFELKIENGSNTRDAYPLYDGLTNRLFTQGEAWHTREVFAKIEGRPINEELWSTEVYWYIPKERTMLVRPDDNYDKTLSEGSDYYIYSDKGLKFSYKINDYYVPGLSDNTIKCEIVVRQGDAVGRISGSRSYGFSTFGASGTDYTIIFNKSEDSKKLIISVVDKDGAPQTDADIQWRWKDANWGNTLSNEIDISDRKNTTYNLIEAKAKVIYNNQEVWVYGYYSVTTVNKMPTFDYPAILPLSIVYENTGSNPMYYKDAWQLFGYKDVAWNIKHYYPAGQGVTSDDYSAYPNIKERYDEDNKTVYDFIVPTSYTEGIYCAIEATVNGKKINYPIYFGINKNQHALLNNWDGAMKIDKAGNYILTSMVTAGHKNADGNTFTGVVMGDIAKLDENGFGPTESGLFGYSAGKQTFAIKTDGSAYIDGHLVVQSLTFSENYSMESAGLTPLDKFNNLQIGGSNLLDGDGLLVFSSNYASYPITCNLKKDHYGIKYYQIKGNINHTERDVSAYTLVSEETFRWDKMVNQQVTISLKIRGYEDVDRKYNFRVGRYYHGIETPILADEGSYGLSISKTWKTISVTIDDFKSWVNEEGPVYKGIVLGLSADALESETTINDKGEKIMSDNVNVTFDIRDIKIELGSKATDWTSSMETINSKFGNLDRAVAEHLGLDGGTVMNKNMVISPYIGGGYLHITGGVGKPSVTINPQQINGVNDDVIFSVNNSKRNVVKITESGTAIFNGTLAAANNNFIVNDNKVKFTDNFTVDNMGNVTVKGSITAKEGAIGSWTVGEVGWGPSYIGLFQSGVDGDGIGFLGNCSKDRPSIWAGYSGGKLSPYDDPDWLKNTTFFVRRNGELHATGATIIGTISSSTITGSTINNGNKTFYVDPDGNVTASSLEITGGSISIGSDFYVSSSGRITAKNGNIGGWGIFDDGFGYVDTYIYFDSLTRGKVKLKPEGVWITVEEKVTGGYEKVLDETVLWTKILGPYIKL